MRSLFHKTIALLLFAVVVTSCHDKDSPNYQYMPDMYTPVSYEAYGEYKVFENGQEAKSPVENSIPRGWMPYEYQNNPQDAAAAKTGSTNPLAYTEDNLNEGKQLYTIYCAICHGDKGDGKGKLVEREKILGVPAYNDSGRAITEGSVYHVMYYGLNNMGSYASQTSIEERWQIDHYVMSLKNSLDGGPEREFEEDPGSENMQSAENADSAQGENNQNNGASQAADDNQTETQE